MQKTRFGITVGLLGAGLYFMGLVSFLGLILLAGYVMLFESNEWLKRSAIKAVAIVVGFSLITVVVSFGNDVFSFLNSLFSLSPSEFHLSYPFNLDALLLSLVNIAQKFVLFILGIKAFSQSSIAVNPIDTLINKNM